MFDITKDLTLVFATGLVLVLSRDALQRNRNHQDKILLHSVLVDQTLVNIHV